MTRWLMAMLIGVFLSVPGCGGDEGCPGIVCTNCAASGDCDIECEADQQEFCGAFGFFEDPGLRCAFCADPDFEF